jgi:hypothetical protein
MKKWYKSKTVWLNIMAVVVFAVQQFTGYVIEPQVQTFIITILNLILRFNTNTAIN